MGTGLHRRAGSGRKRIRRCEMNRDNIKRRIASEKETLEVHEHVFVSGPRRKSGYGKDGKWHTCGETIRHSHPGGNVPRNHPHTGPSYYGYRTPKVTKRPIGEQGLEVISRTDEQNRSEERRVGK